MGKLIETERRELEKMIDLLRQQQANWLKREVAALQAGYPNLSRRNYRLAEELEEIVFQIQHLIEEYGRD